MSNHGARPGFTKCTRQPVPAWQQKPLPCRHHPELFHSFDPGETGRAIDICMGCPVRTDCLQHALDHQEWHGVWGGMTEEHRKTIARARGMRVPV